MSTLILTIKEPGDLADLERFLAYANKLGYPDYSPVEAHFDQVSISQEVAEVKAP